MFLVVYSKSADTSANSDFGFSLVSVPSYKVRIIPSLVYRYGSKVTVFVVDPTTITSS